MSTDASHDLSPDDKAFVAIVTNAIDTCDTEELMRLKKDVLVMLNKEAKLPYSNRNKEELIKQLTEWKGCWCNLREASRGVATVCRFMTAAAVGAVVMGALAQETTNKYIWKDWWTGKTMSYVRDNNAITSEYNAAIGLGVAAAAMTGALVAKRRSKGNPLIKEAYEPDQY
jgi:hypothetical protein